MYQSEDWDGGFSSAPPKGSASGVRAVIQAGHDGPVLAGLFPHFLTGRDTRSAALPRAVRGATALGGRLTTQRPERVPAGREVNVGVGFGVALAEVGIVGADVRTSRARLWARSMSTTQLVPTRTQVAWPRTLPASMRPRPPGVVARQVTETLWGEVCHWALSRAGATMPQEASSRSGRKRRRRLMHSGFQGG